MDACADNTRALVFLGVAAEGLGDHNNALEAYKKAISAAPDGDLLPWQGLGTFYEKHAPDSPEELTAVYKKLVLLNAGYASCLELVTKSASFSLLYLFGLC